MPYIPVSQRLPIAEARSALNPETMTDGEFNFLLTSLVRDRLGASFTYSDALRAAMTLEMVKLELYRRVIAPFEDEKRANNGDVF